MRQSSRDSTAALQGWPPCWSEMIQPVTSMFEISAGACRQAGITSHHHELAEDATQEELVDLIGRLNKDSNVNGILVQSPLPSQIDAAAIVDAIRPAKDVDAFHADNVGRMLQGRPRFLPCTPFGIQQLLHRSSISVNGAYAVVIGRSDIVGKPLAMMLAQKNSPLGPNVCNATVDRVSQSHRQPGRDHEEGRYPGCRHWAAPVRDRRYDQAWGDRHRRWD